MSKEIAEVQQELHLDRVNLGKEVKLAQEALIWDHRLPIWESPKRDLIASNSVVYAGSNLARFRIRVDYEGGGGMSQRYVATLNLSSQDIARLDAAPSRFGFATVEIGLRQAITVRRWSCLPFTMETQESEVDVMSLRLVVSTMTRASKVRDALKAWLSPTVMGETPSGDESFRVNPPDPGEFPPMEPPGGIFRG